MRTIATTLIAAAAGLALVACGGNDPVAEEAENTAGLPSVDNVAGGNDGMPSADGSAPAAGAAVQGAAPNAASAAAIPAALHGRWGLTPADCTANAASTRGLLMVGADGLRFYESQAVPVRNVEVGNDYIRADFAFNGEGQSWTKFQALTLEEDKLVRTESSPMASFTYARCR